MIVLDASALIDWLLLTPETGPAVARTIDRDRPARTLDLATVEVLSALRRKVSRGELEASRAEEALLDLTEARIGRHRASPLARRIWELRSTLSPHDAAYVALAEGIGAPLVTTDRRLVRAGGHRATVVYAGAL